MGPSYVMCFGDWREHPNTHLEASVRGVHRMSVENCDFIIATCKKCEKIQSIFYFPFYYFSFASSIVTMLQGHQRRRDGWVAFKCVVNMQHCDGRSARDDIRGTKQTQIWKFTYWRAAIWQNCCSINTFECKFQWRKSLKRIRGVIQIFSIIFPIWPPSMVSSD